MSAPPSVPPAGVPGSNTKYAAVVIILLLGIGAILLWKFVLNKPEQPVVQPTPSAVPSAPPSGTGEISTAKLNAVPPPPPVESAPTATATAKGPAVTGTGGTGGCDAKCTGQAPGDLAGALQVRASMARRCYQAALANDSSLKGRVVVGVKVSPNGSVCSASVAQSDIPAISGCVASVFRGGNFPAPHGGCVDTMVPMSFSPAQ